VEPYTEAELCPNSVVLGQLALPFPRN